MAFGSRSRFLRRRAGGGSSREGAISPMMSKSWAVCEQSGLFRHACGSRLGELAVPWDPKRRSRAGGPESSPTSLLVALRRRQAAMMLAQIAVLRRLLRCRGAFQRPTASEPHCHLADEHRAYCCARPPSNRLGTVLAPCACKRSAAAS